MTIAYDATSNATPGTGTLSWTHTPVGTPRGVIVFVMQYQNGTDQVTGVTYGGTAMTEVTGSPLLKTSGEAMAVYCYFLGAAVPTGAQTVQVSVNATGSEKAAVCFSVTGADTITVQEADATITSDAATNPSTTLALGGREAFCAIGFCAGGANVAAITPLTNWTSSYEYDAGAEQLAAYRYNTVSTTDVTAGWTQAEDDALAIAIALREATLLVTKSEGVTIGDSGAAALADALAVSKSEGVTVGESVEVEIPTEAQPDRDINVTDGVTLGESNSQAMSDLELSKSEGVTVGEAANVTVPAVDELTISATDGLAVADLLPGRYVDNITLGEEVTVSLGVVADFEITVSDGVTLGESNSQALDDLAVSQAEGVTVADAATASLPDDLAINQSDNITLGEASNVILEVEGEYYVSVSDGVTLGEAATAAIADDLALSLFEGVTLGEAVTVSIAAVADLDITATDGVTVADATAISLPDALVISLFEGVTLGEYATSAVVSGDLSSMWRGLRKRQPRRMIVND